MKSYKKTTNLNLACETQSAERQYCQVNIEEVAFKAHKNVYQLKSRPLKVTEPGEIPFRRSIRQGHIGVSALAPRVYESLKSLEFHCEEEKKRKHN